MSVPGFTPGPWRWSSYHGEVLGSPLSIDGCRPPVARMLEVSERLANASLIAAAPDLYAALERFALRGPGHVVTEDEWEQAGAALAKARGASDE